MVRAPPRFPLGSLALPAHAWEGRGWPGPSASLPVSRVCVITKLGPCGRGLPRGLGGLGGMGARAGGRPAGSRSARGCWAWTPCGASGGVAAPCSHPGWVWGVGARGWRATVTPRRPASRCTTQLAGAAALLSLCPPCTGSKSGSHRCTVSREGTASILLRFVAVCSRAPPEGGVPWRVQCRRSPRRLGGRRAQHMSRR